MAEKPPEPPVVKPIDDKPGPVKIYLWMPDKNGKLVKAEASIVKKSFAILPNSAHIALTEYLFVVQNKLPTDAARQALWNDIVDGAVAAFEGGKKQTPWDVLEELTENSPPITGENVTYTQYDELASNALLNKIGTSIGYDLTTLTDADREEFFNKLQTEAKISGKSTTRKAKGGGTQTVIIPSLFDAKTFTESFLWAKVNFADTTKLPSSVITQISGIKSLLRANGINDLSTKEINAFGIALASGQKTIDSFKTELATRAAKQYPLFNKRLMDTPGLTVMDIVEPYIKEMAKWWEVDPEGVDLSNPDLDKFIRPDGTAGNVPMGPISDWITYLKNHPNSEKTIWAKEAARDGAVGVASAMGFGI